MALHQTSGRWRLGLCFALLTAACWATLPVVLKITLEALDPFTLTWFRFLAATLVMLVWLAARGGLSGFAALDKKRWGLLATAALLLIGNYIFYLLGLQHTSPANAQLLIQLAPLLMALGGIFIFREPYQIGQWCGLVTIAIGLVLFFRDQLHVSGLTNSAYLLGSGFVIIAAVVWAGYALLQKQLLLRLSSPAVLLFIYAAASVLLLPLAHPAMLLKLDGRHWLLLGYCVLNTLVAYGAFGEALAHWEASRVSTILATTPLLCIGFIALLHSMAPTLIASEQVSTLGYFGAILVMLGSAMSSLLGKRTVAASQPI